MSKKDVKDTLTMLDINGKLLAKDDLVYYAHKTRGFLKVKVHKIDNSSSYSPDKGYVNRLCVYLRVIDRKPKEYSKYTTDSPQTHLLFIKKAPKQQPKSQPIGMYNKNNQSVLYWAFPSIGEAELDYSNMHFRKTGEKKRHGGIRRCVNGKQTSAYGKIFRKITKEEYEKWDE